MNDYKNWSGTYKTLATCPTSAKIVGDDVILTVNITQGTSPYTITYKKDGVTLGTPVTAPSIGTYYYVYKTVSDDVGTPIFSADVVDSCATPQTWTDQCIVNITAPLPPSCDFTWSPTNPTVNEIITVTSLDTTLTSHEYLLNGIYITYRASFEMVIAVAGTHTLQHNGVSQSGSCTLEKYITVSRPCTQPTCDFTVI